MTVILQIVICPVYILKYNVQGLLLYPSAILRSLVTFIPHGLGSTISTCGEFLLELPLFVLI